MPGDNEYYLKKHDDGSIHGPVDLEQLRDWSLAAKVSPLDRVSNDAKRTWRRAPMIPSLHMDWLVEVSDDYLYGPTTFGAVQEFLAADEISVEAFIINTIDGTRAQIKDMPAFRTTGGEGGSSPGRITGRLEAAEDASAEKDSEASLLSERLVKVERMLVQQRRALEEAELRYQRLRAQYIEKTGENP